ncbi:hypothetical protein AB1388_11780 [Streptomyces hydrogenans]|uniref:hypothetical protein n=1 Tax=Streptomyces hydrogenans TaxID=1873719 RepID=UPI00345CC7A9
MACTLADAAGPSHWSADAVEDVAATLEVLAGALAQLDLEYPEILSVVLVAAAAVVERAKQAAAGASESVGGKAMAGESAALRQALAAHGLTRHRVQQLRAALVTVTLDVPEAQGLAVILSRRDALPRQAQPEDEDDWGVGTGGYRGRRAPRARYGRVRAGPCLRAGERRPHPADRPGGGRGSHRPAQRHVA